jgi:hypothetical protein
VPIEGGLGRAAGAVHVVLAFREDQARRLLGSLEVVKKTKTRNGSAETGITT